MKRYTATEARKHLSDLLDAAERGEPVLIERRGAKFEIRAEIPKHRRSSRSPLFDIVDPAVERGSWSWASTKQGLKFVPRRRARR